MKIRMFTMVCRTDYRVIACQAGPFFIDVTDEYLQGIISPG